MNGPFSVRRTVTWGDCDPAGIIYTPRVLDHAVAAVEVWYREVLQAPWFDLNWRRHMGAPFVRAECDFIRAPACDDEMLVEVRVNRIGRSSATYVVVGTDDEGRHYFRATLVACFIARPDFRSAPIPDDIRQRMTAYQAACGDAPED